MDTVDSFSWDAARCTAQGEDMFVQGAAQHAAKKVCAGCPMKTLCLAEALDNRIEHGVWGGLTERERRVALRKRPNVTSWRALFDEMARQSQPVELVAPGSGSTFGTVA